MTYQQAVEYIDSFLIFGSKLGLAHITKLLDKLGNPQKKLKFIHVAGTNGKGSTCAYIESVLRAAGYKTGMFISPYIVDFKERFQLNGQMIGESELSECTQIVKNVVDTFEPNELPTEFEIITAIGFVYFLKSNCDVVVLEVGLGGRFDSTNVIDTPLCSVICSISLDHTAILGDTIEKIAFEKAGIIKQNGTTVCYSNQQQDALNVVKKAAKERNNKLVIPDFSNVKIIEKGFGKTDVCYNDFNFSIKINGTCQPYNAITAIEAVKNCGLAVSNDAIKTGLNDAFSPARCEVLSENPCIILDGAHNPDGVKSLAQLLKKHFAKKPVAVIGMMADKDINSVMSQLAPCFSKIFTVTVNNPRSISASDLAKTASAYCNSVFAVKSPQNAVDSALKTGENVCVCGSFYLASELRNYIQKNILFD